MFDTLISIYNIHFQKDNSLHKSFLFVLVSNHLTYKVFDVVLVKTTSKQLFLNQAKIF